MHPLGALFSVALVVAGAGLAAGCGGADKPDAASPADDSRVAARSDGPRERHLPPDDADLGADEGLEIEGLRGHLDPADVQAGIEPHASRFAACYESRHRTQRFLDGKIELKFVVDRTGAVVSVQVFDGSLGAWPVELCVLEIARGIQFEAPRGKGNAEFSVPLEFAPGRMSAIWLLEEQAEAEVVERLPELDACAEQAEVSAPRDEVWVTLYVGRRGKVQAAGFASRGAEPLDDAWAACAETTVLGWQLTDPRGRIHKLGFRYNP